MIRHTAVEALYVSAFQAEEEDARSSARKSAPFAEPGNNRTSISALIKIICNPSNSATLRATACECLGERILAAPEFAAFAASELFARHEAGASTEIIFDALLQVIRETPFATGSLFIDAVEALSERHRDTRIAAAERFLKALRQQPLPSAMTASKLPHFMMKDVMQRA